MFYLRENNDTRTVGPKSVISFFFKIRFTGQTDLIVFRYSAANNDLPYSNQSDIVSVKETKLLCFSP
jgi:hypothetical protein